MSRIEETYLKLHCKCCGRETPHVDNSTTVQCCVCYQSNYEMSYENRFYDGWELAAFWHMEYYNAKSNVIGTVVAVGFENNWAPIPGAKVMYPQATVFGMQETIAANQFKGGAFK